MSSFAAGPGLECAHRGQVQGGQAWQALGIVSRVAPQMNIYAIGFPITLSVGLIGVAVALPMLEQPFATLTQRMLDLFNR